MKDLTIGLVGNPNCGKTTLFNRLTGARQRVGNWPGVTVDRKSGSCRCGDRRLAVIDTPGIYALAAASLDEQVTRDFLLSGEADVVVNIVDATNIERNLYLTSQLLEMRVPLVVALNMMDVAEERRLAIDVAGLAARLGCPVVAMTASRNRGVDELKQAILETAGHRHTPPQVVVMPAAVATARDTLAASLQEAGLGGEADNRWLALKLLEGDEQVENALVPHPEVGEQATLLRARIEDQEGEEADIVIASARYAFISALTSAVVENRGEVSASLSDRIDRVVLSRVFGLPLFLAAMYLVFLFTINLGGAFIDFFDQLAGVLFVDGLATLLTFLHAPDWLIAVLATGIGGGLQTMATFIPPIGCMFICLSFLEDSGYMARAAFVMDRFMRLIGLPGKAFVPLLVGFGCNVPAIMAARTLDSERDRILTVMMAPFMSCGARLPVYALFAAAFFPTGGQNLVFALYLIGIGFAVFTGLVLKNTLLKGEAAPFVMEMPPYHLPSVTTVVLRAYERMQAFLFKAGKILVPVIMVLALLNSLGTDGTFGNENTERSALAAVSRQITPVLAPMGVSADNWPATVGLFTGIFAKEAVVGTLDALYSGMGGSLAKGAEEKPFSLWGAMVGAFATVPANLVGVLDTLVDPLGLSIGEVADRDLAAEEQGVTTATFGSMVTLFGSQSAAFAYLLFVLLYFPCSAAIAAVYRETGVGWTLFAGAWTTGLAYLAASVFYQAVNFAARPQYALTVIAVGLAALALSVVLLYLAGVIATGRRRRPVPGATRVGFADSRSGGGPWT
ncbi:MAG: Fe(2+) transporter permease subunit FeoB [Desulfobulbus sp.]|jgi:ferrous iron transport protein B|nr:Fe(2+) transporter permease subunit FeoB [Desulfobulbus sp.]